MDISIRGLFGYFDYDISVQDGGITILTGPNGFGKSTIIRCLEAIANSNLSFFLGLDFEKIVISDSDINKNLKIINKEDALIINEKKIDKRNVRYLMRGVNLEKEIDDFSQALSYQKVLREMKEILKDVKLIQEQRLIKNLMPRRTIDREGIKRHASARGVIEQIREVPNKLYEKMQEVEKRYSQVSNELDSTYPERLFRQNEGVNEEEFQEKLQLMSDKVNKLNKYGISKVKGLKNVNFRTEDARALKIYFEDFDQKYQEYKEFIECLELFVKIVNKRFKFKYIEVTNDVGLRVVDEKHGHPIPLSKLSSGEQEIIVLFYELLFEVPKGTLLLIDEPEISLHITWQRLFMEDLEQIVKMKSVTVIVATHSPQMISGNRQRQIDLGELYKNGLYQRK